MKPYECLFIIRNDVKDEDRTKLVDKFSKMASANTKVETWGLRKFAQPIDYKKDGYYYLMNFEATPDVPKKMGALMNITEGLVRYMFVDLSEVQKPGKPAKKDKKKAEAVNE